jgi:hypothetical protein
MSASETFVFNLDAFSVGQRVFWGSKSDCLGMTVSEVSLNRLIRKTCMEVKHIIGTYENCHIWPQDERFDVDICGYRKDRNVTKQYRDDFP